MQLAKKLSIAVLLGAAAAMPLTAVPLLDSPAFAQALSAAVGKPLQQASTAAKAGNIAAAKTAVDQARAAAKTPAERTKVGEMAAFVYTRGGQFAQAAAELERIGAPSTQIAPLYYQAKQYDKAIEHARKGGQSTIIAQSYLMQGKTADAAKIYEQMLARNPNNPSVLQNLAGVQFKMGDKKAYLATTEKLIKLDPTPERWRALLLDVKNQKLSNQSKLALYHLMQETGNMTNPADVQDFAKIAIVSNQAGVAANVLKTAGEKGVIKPDDAMNARMMQAAGQRQAQAISGAPAAAKAPATALDAGNAFIGAGQYPQAVAAFTTAEKGPKAAEASLFKGIAQVRAGNVSAARTTFTGLNSGDLGEVAGLWQLYTSTKS